MRILILSLLFLCNINAFSQTSQEWFNRGLDKKYLEDYRGAIADFNKAIELDPNNVRAYVNRGLAKRSLGDSRGAIVDYNKAIELDPKSANTYFNRGIAKHDLKDKNGACLDWSKSGELGDGAAYGLIKSFCN